jgi:hypothetical protein
MSRRFSGGRRARGQTAQSRRAALFAQVLALSGGRPIFTADRYTVDGVSGKTAAFVDWSDSARTLAQATSAQQVALPASHASFSGSLCATFAGGQWYDSNQAAAFWDYMVDGAGVTSILVSEPTSAVGFQGYATTAFSGINPGYFLYGNAGDPNLAIYGASGVAVVSSSFGAGALAPYVLTIEHGTSRTPDWSAKRTGTAAATGAYGAAVGSPTESTLRLGAYGNGSNPASMRWRALLTFPLLTSAQLAIVHAWIQADTGLAP